MNWERILADAMRAPDPVSVLRQRWGNDAEKTKWLASLDEDGVRIQALLIARLRFERLMAGSELALTRFETDPAEFARVFRAYHRATPLSAFFPSEEAKLFAHWWQSQRD